MSDKEPNAFSALRIAERMTPEQLEYLTEFSDQVESLRYLSRNISGQQPTLQEAIEIVEAAPEALKKKRKRKRPKSKADKAWLAELGAELTDKKQKEGSRHPAVLSFREIRALLRAARPDKRDYLLLRTFYSSAMRISEVANIVVGDLYLDELKIFVREGKGDKDRYVLIDPLTAKLLRQFTAGLGPADRVFEIGVRQIARVVEKYAEDLGITQRYTAIERNFTPHSLRHTAATHLYERGMDIYVIQELLGHAYIETTREYIFIGINRQRKHYQAYHPLCQPEMEEDLEDD